MTVKPPARPTPLVLRPLRFLDGAIRRVEVTLLVVVLLLMIGLSFAQVATRLLRPYVPWLQPVPWFDDLARHFVLWVGMLGASIATREGRHFGVEALPKLFGERGRRYLEAFLNGVAGVFCAVLTLIMWNDIVLDEIPRSREHHLFVIEAIQLANVSEAGTHPFPVEKWWLLAVIPAGLAGMTFRFLLRSLEAAILTDAEWHWLERELKPDLVAAADPAANPASLGTGAVVESGTPPAVADTQVAAAHAQSERLEQGLPPPSDPAPAPPESKRRTPTEEVRTYRLGDLGDVEDPEARSGAGGQPDAEESLVDSDVLMADRSEDEQSSSAPTDRQKAQEPEREPRPDAPGAPGSGEKRS